jgi:hypothetical protein
LTDKLGVVAMVVEAVAAPAPAPMIPLIQCKVDQEDLVVVVAEEESISLV